MEPEEIELNGSDSGATAPAGAGDASCGRNLRARAEGRCAAKPAAGRAALTLEDAQRNLHELQVATLELEMQNEELRAAQLEMEETRARYFELFELAPVGYLILDASEAILDANLTATALLGVSKGALVGQLLGSFLAPEDQDLFHLLRRKVSEAGPQVCEVRLALPSPNAAFWVHLVCAASRNGGYRVTLTDNSEMHRRREKLGALVQERTEELERRNELLELEIAERKRAEEALSRSEQRYRAVVEDQTELVVRFRPDGRVTFANQAYCRFFGTTHDEVLASGWRPKVVPEDVPNLERRLKYLAPHNPVVAVENRVISGEGDVRWMQFVNRGFFDARGALEETQAVGRDITERKHAEQMLLVYADEVQDLYNKAPCGYHSLDENGVFVRINDTELNWLGYQRHEVVGVKRFSDLVTPEGVPRFRDNFRKFLEQGSLVELEYDMVRQDGSSFPVILNAELQRDADGRFLMSRGTVFDNTERRKAERELQKSELQFRQMAKTVGEVFWLSSSATGAVLYASPAFERIWGRSCAELYADPGLWMEAVLPEYLPQVGRDLALLARGTPVAMEYRIARPDGSLRWISDRCYPLDDGAGGGTMVAGVASDITERKQAEETLKKYARRLIVLEEDLRKRIAVELHDDIGQVLTALGLNLAHIGNRLQPEGDGNLRSVLEDSRVLTKEISRTVRRLMVELHPTQLEEYGLEAAVRSHAEQFAQRTGIAVSVQADPGLPRLTAKQEIALFRITQEALSNVSKHACAARVTVALRREGRALGLTIADDGVGFRPLAAAPRPAGSGWGLTIMRERAQLIGGSFRVDAAPGEGTTVAVALGGRG